MKRLEVKDFVTSFSKYDLEGDFYVVIRNLQDAIRYYKDEVTETYDSFEIQINSEDQFEIFACRLENDKEYNSRIEKCKKEQQRRKKRKEAAKNAEYETYLKLKEKYDSSKTS